MFLALSIALGLLVVYLLVAAIRPLLEREVVTADDWDRLDDDASQLLSRRDRLVAELRDLEHEAALDKLDARDLATLRLQYENEALAAEEKLDEAAAGIRGRVERALADHARAGADPAPARSGPKSAPATAATRAADQKPKEPASGGDGGQPGPSAESGGPLAERDGRSFEVSAPPVEVNVPSDGAAATSAFAPARLASEAAPERHAEGDGPRELAAGERCSGCGASVVPGGQFCDGCGQTLRGPRCEACHVDNRVGARFCRGCGAQLMGAVEAQEKGP